MNTRVVIASARAATVFAAGLIVGSGCGGGGETEASRTPSADSPGEADLVAESKTVEEAGARAVEEASTAVADAVDDAVDTAGDIVDGAADAATDAATDAVDAAADTAAGAVDDGTRAAGDATDATDDAVDDTKGDAVDDATEAAVDGADEAVEGAVESLGSAMAGAAGDTIAVAATKAGLTRVGVRKCKMCHKVQHASWAESPHASLDPPLDCESCHGPGSEYKSKSVMKDPEAARAAGLVVPEKSFCMASCHGDDWQDDMLERTHAHKEEEEES